MNIANKIYGYSKGAAMGKLKHSRKGIKIASPVPLTIMEHYKDIHLDIDLLFVNKIPFLLVISRDIGFIHYKALLSKHDKQVQNGLQ